MQVDAYIRTGMHTEHTDPLGFIQMLLDADTDAHGCRRKAKGAGYPAVGNVSQAQTDLI